MIVENTSMDVSTWMALESAMQGDQPRRGVDRKTLGRIWGFARPHRWALLSFLVLSVIGAALTVATPILAGQVVDIIVAQGDASTVVQLALVIAGLAVLDAGAGLLGRWLSSRIGEGLILD